MNILDLTAEEKPEYTPHFFVEWHQQLLMALPKDAVTYLEQTQATADVITEQLKQHPEVVPNNRDASVMKTRYIIYRMGFKRLGLCTEVTADRYTLTHFPHFTQFADEVYLAKQGTAPDKDSTEPEQDVKKHQSLAAYHQLRDRLQTAIINRKHALAEQEREVLRHV